MDALPTFIANDVIKMPDVPRYTAEYRKHLAFLLNWSCGEGGHAYRVARNCAHASGQHHRQAVLDSLRKLFNRS